MAKRLDQTIKPSMWSGAGLDFATRFTTMFAAAQAKAAATTRATPSAVIVASRLSPITARPAPASSDPTHVTAAARIPVAK